MLFVLSDNENNEWVLLLFHIMKARVVVFCVR